MELHEFQIFYRCTGLPGQGNALSAGLGRIGGVGKQMSTAAAGQHHGAGLDVLQVAAIQHLHPTTAAVLHIKPGDPHASAVQQTGPLFDPLTQDIHQGASGAVLHMQHASMAVGCFQGRGQAMAVAVKGHPQLLEAIHTTRCGVHQKPHGIAVT